MKVRPVAEGTDGVRARLLRASIPTVLNRLIQQALLQILQPMLEPDCCDRATATGRVWLDVERQGVSFVRTGRGISLGFILASPLVYCWEANSAILAYPRKGERNEL